LRGDRLKFDWNIWTQRARRWRGSNCAAIRWAPARQEFKEDNAKSVEI